VVNGELATAVSSPVEGLTLKTLTLSAEPVSSKATINLGAWRVVDVELSPQAIRTAVSVNKHAIPKQRAIFLLLSSLVVI
jgi:hypothetical protein